MGAILFSDTEPSANVKLDVILELLVSFPAFVVNKQYMSGMLDSLDRLFYNL